MKCSTCFLLAIFLLGAASLNAQSAVDEPARPFVVRAQLALGTADGIGSVSFSRLTNSGFSHGISVSVGHPNIGIQLSYLGARYDYQDDLLEKFPSLQNRDLSSNAFFDAFLIGVYGGYGNRRLRFDLGLGGGIMAMEFPELAPGVFAHEFQLARAAYLRFQPSVYVMRRLMLGVGLDAMFYRGSTLPSDAFGRYYAVIGVEL